MTPSHHTKRGFRNPWPDAEPRGFRDLLRWSIERRRHSVPPNPKPGTFPVAQPTFSKRAHDGELTVTWVGHSTVLLQIGPVNILADPMWSDRASPVSFAGPRRFVPPAFELDALPPIDIVLISHNHYDHLDQRTVRALTVRLPEIEWVAPLRLARTLRQWGANKVRELDWWQCAQIQLSAGQVEVACVPAQHFSARSFGDRGRTLWCSWAVSAFQRRAFFAGDTAYHPEFRAMGERFGPFDLVMLPVGAYDPRWFMRTVHMNPPEALRAYAELTGERAGRVPMLPIHWGTFRLTDEAMEEPPAWTAQLWREAGYEPSALWLLQHGETRISMD